MNKETHCQCPVCKRIILHTERSTQTGYRYTCKICQNKSSREYAKTTRGQIAKYKAKKENVKWKQTDRRKKYEIRYGELAQVKRLQNILTRRFLNEEKRSNSRLT